MAVTRAKKRSGIDRYGGGFTAHASLRLEGAGKSGACDIANYRFGAVEKKGSIALIERLWRTLKNTLGLRLLRPLAAEDLMEKVEIGLVHYAHFRPHQGIGGATPAEIYFRRTPAHLSAIPPPRGRAGEGPMDLPLRVDYLDAERLLPLLLRKAA